MAVYKNKASQKVACFAYDSTDGSAKTGDAANITAQISLDGGTTAATDDTNPTELDATDAPGVYLFDLTQAETNADLIVIAPVSATSDIYVEPLIIYSEPEQRAADVTSLSGDSTAADNLEAALDGTGSVTISANLDGSVGSVTGAVASVTGNVGGNVTGSVGSVLGGIDTSGGTITTLDGLDTAQDTQHGTTQTAISGLNNLSAANVNAEVLDVLNVDTFSEPGQGAPTATPTIRQMLHYLYKFWRNKKTNDGNETSLFADDTTTVDQKQTTSSSSGTVTLDEWTTGA